MKSFNILYTCIVHIYYTLRAEQLSFFMSNVPCSRVSPYYLFYLTATMAGFLLTYFVFVLF